MSLKTIVMFPEELYLPSFFAMEGEKPTEVGVGVCESKLCATTIVGTPHPFNVQIQSIKN